jgi:hypothetical protein
MQDKSLRELAFLFLDNEMDSENRVSFRARIECCNETQQETQYCLRLLTVVREHCPRQHAPPQLRRRILAVIQGPEDPN